MPKGPNGQKRKADSIGMSVMVAKIATGEVEDTRSGGRRASGIAGAKARAAALTAAERSRIERKDGLLDVKFYIKNGELKENVCAEINRLDLAVERGEYQPLVFGKTRKQSDC